MWELSELGPQSADRLSRLDLLILVFWQEDGRWHLLKALQTRLRQVKVLHPTLTKRPLGRLLTKFARTLTEIALPMRALGDSSQVVLSWTMRYGVWYGILRRLLQRKRPPVHVLWDFHINLTRVDFIYRLRLLFLRVALPGIDVFLCTSREEFDIYHKRFGIPLDRLRFVPLSPEPHLLERTALPRGDYIFSYGNSDRDFDTLLRAVQGLEVRVIILSQAYRPEITLPANVIWKDHSIPYTELLELISNARIVVLPLLSYHIAAGQLSMIETMALGVPVVVTANMATREYADHGETAMFFEAGNSSKLKAEIEYLLDHPDVTAQLGVKGRERAHGFPQQQYTAFLELMEDLAQGGAI